MAFRLEGKVHVVEAGHERSQPLEFSLDALRIVHREPLVRGPRLRNERIDAGADPTDAAAPACVPQHRLADLRRQIPDRHDVVFVLGRQADHVVQLQVLDAGGEDPVGLLENLLVGHCLVDHPPEAIGSGFRRDRERAFAALVQQPDDRIGQIVETKRRRADRVTHLDQPGEQSLDVRMVAERDRHEAYAARLRASRFGNL